MGCTTSRQARHDLRYCPSPLPRSQSFPARCPSDAAHVVRLTSSTLGSLAELDDKVVVVTTEATITTRPRTPTMTPPNEPEPIDAWALMAGLEDHCSPLLPPPTPFGRHSFSFPPAAAPPHDLAKVTPLPPMPAVITGCSGEEKEKAMSKEEKKAAPRRAVLYFTSLRGVRATYEACCLARGILKGYGVRVDERDVSMHRGFRDELAALLLLGSKRCSPVLPLPSLFVDGELVGDGEEVKRMHEAGELAARLAGCEREDDGACEACGNVRFVLCEVCSGSCKVFVNDEDDLEEEEEVDVSDGGGARFRRCTECNENGIVRCPVCC